MTQDELVSITPRGIEFLSVRSPVLHQGITEKVLMRRYVWYKCDDCDFRYVDRQNNPAQQGCPYCDGVCHPYRTPNHGNTRGDIIPVGLLRRVP